MKDKEKIFKHLQDKLTSVRGGENGDEIDELSKQVALARVFLRAEKQFHEVKNSEEKKS
jgi:hypothetical protein